MNIPYGDKEIAEVKKQIKWLYKSPDEGWTDTNGTRHQYLEPFEYNGELYYPGGEYTCLLYTSPSPRDLSTSRMPSSA